MGSLFSPSVPSTPAFTYQPTGSQPTPTNISTSSDEGDNTQTTNSEAPSSQQDEDSVRDFIRRTNRGRNSLIQTSYRGVLTDTNNLTPQRKNLLGE